MRKADVVEAFWLAVVAGIVLQLPAAAAYIADMQSAVADRGSCRPTMGVLRHASPPVASGLGNGSHLRGNRSQIHHRLHSRCQMPALAHLNKPVTNSARRKVSAGVHDLPVSDSCLPLW